MSGNDSNDDDRTVMRPRGPTPVPQSPAPVPPAGAPPTGVGLSRPSPPPPAAAPASLADFTGKSLNPLVQAATPLLLLGVQLRHSVTPPIGMNLREQAAAQIRQFENRAQSSGVSPQTVSAARYALCTMIDESVLNTPWGEQSGWGAKTLLVIFHNEAWGGEKFFQILERLTQDFNRHVDLIELMYVCLVLGFAGRYQVEAGGRGRLAEIQEDLYRRIKALRPAAADELSPHWQGIEDRRNPLIRYVPLWVVAAACACIVLGAFLFFYSRLNEHSSPLSAKLAQIGLQGAAPAETQPKPAVPHPHLKQLLAAEEQAGQLSIDEDTSGRSLVRLNAAEMFPSGGTQVAADEVALLNKITQALNQVPGRVVVVGHTDDQPVRSLRFKDNYELSAERARAVAAILSQGLDNPARIESSGAGSSQPIATPPDTSANRARNRRVEIIHTPEG